jgi:serine/threonine-protein kinase RsbW
MSPGSSIGPEDHGLSELLDLRVPAESGAIATVTDAIAETLSQLKVPEQKRLEITLAAQEALANAVAHGCHRDPSKNVRCRLKCDAHGRILVVVTDPGPGFSPDRLPDPNRRDLYSEGGRGVYLMRQLMDEVQFEHGGNEVRMWKY